MLWHLRIQALVGPLNARERANLLGRLSACREEAEARGLGHRLPPPPQFADDATLRHAAAREARLQERLLTQAASQSRGRRK